MSEDLYRVYTREWLTRFVSCREDAEQEARAHFEQGYAGRIRPEDWRIEPSIGNSWALGLRLPNLRGEFKFKPDAEKYAALFTDAVIVVRSSAEEKELLGYGRRKLASS